MLVDWPRFTSGHSKKDKRGNVHFQPILLKKSVFSNCQNTDRRKHLFCALLKSESGSRTLQGWVSNYIGAVRLAVSEAGASGLPTCDPLPNERGLQAYRPHNFT